MKKFYWLLYSILLALVMTLPVAADQITYDFEDVKVNFAASFDATPVSVHVYDWFADKSGGPGKPINILYGIVDLKSSNGIWKEEFIKVTGENGSEISLEFNVNGVV